MDIEYADWTDINGLAVKQKGMYAVYIANRLEDNAYDYIWTRIQAGCSQFMPIDKVMDIMHGGLFFFKTEKSMLKFFNVFNEKPIYSSAVYAASYDKNGNQLSENT